jgi:uncharacterized protein YjbJ (UPF0337 family)
MDLVNSKIIEPFKIIGDWDVQSKKLKEKFSELTDEDLKYEPGKELDLLARVEARLNKKRDEVIHIIKRGRTQGFKAF